MVLAAAERGLAPDGTLQYVTAGIDVRYRRPSPLHEPAELVARLVSADENEILVDAELWWQGKVRASRAPPGSAGVPRTRRDRSPACPRLSAPPVLNGCAPRAKGLGSPAQTGLRSRVKLR